MTKCKYMRTKYNWTPNDYDIRFPSDQIPSNIKVENTANLQKRLQKKMPLTKTIHLDLEEDNRTYANQIEAHTTLSLTINNVRNEVMLE